MSKTLSILITVIAFFLLVAIQYGFQEFQYARQEVTLQELDSRVNALEKILPDTSKGTITPLKAATLEVQIKAVKQQLKETEFNLKSDFGNLLKFGLPVTLIALITFFLSLYKYVYETAIDKAKEQIRKNFRPREEQIKEESKILLLTQPTADDSKMYNFLIKSGFSNIVSKKIEGFKLVDDQDQPLNLGNFDLLFFNNEGKKYEESDVLNYINNAPKAMIFWAKGGFLHDPQLKDNEKISSASFTSQIYGNLLNILDYQRSVRKNTSQA